MYSIMPPRQGGKRDGPFVLHEIGKCTVILILATAAAAAANHFRAKPLTWIRRDVTPSATKPSMTLETSARQSAPAESVETATAEDAERSAQPVLPPDDAPADPAQPAATESTAPGMAAEEVAATIEDVLDALQTGSAFLVDAREDHEFADGHLRGALHLPSSAIYKNIERVSSVVPVDAKVIVYCGGGQCEASHNVSDALRRDFGYAHVVIYLKGWEEVVGSGRFEAFIERGGE